MIDTARTAEPVAATPAPAPSRAVYTVGQLAERLGIDSGKVIGWIRRGELAAINVATRTSSRPRWRITAEALAAFERSRSSRPTEVVKMARRRRADPEVIQFF